MKNSNIKLESYLNARYLLRFLWLPFAVSLMYFLYASYGWSSSKKLKPLTRATGDLLKIYQSNHRLHGEAEVKLFAVPGDMPGCRFFLFESLYMECAEVLVSSKEPLPPEWIESLRYALSSPCSFSQANENYGAIEYFRCDSTGKSYRVQLTIQTYTTKTEITGAASTDKRIASTEYISGKK